MSITVLDCLQLPSLKNATVIAGRAGLGNIVNSISVFEFLDESLLTSKDPFFSNEMLLSALMDVKDDIDKQCATIKILKDTGDVCLVLYYLGHVILELDSRVIDLANTLDFPIIAMPKKRTDFRYSEVISEVYEAIIRDRNKNKKIIHNISQIISHLPNNKRNIKNLMQMLSDRLKCSLLLSDASLTNIYLTKWPLSNNLTAEELRRFFTDGENDKESYFQAIFENSPVLVFHVPFTAPEYHNLSLYALDESNSATIDDIYQVIDVLQLFSKMWDLNANNLLEEALIPAIIENDDVKMHQIAAKLNLNISAINTLILVNLEVSWDNPHDRILAKTDFINLSKTILKRHGKSLVVDVYDDYVCIMVDYSGLSPNDRQFIQDLKVAYDELQTNYSITLCSNLQTASDVREAYLSYDENLSAMRRIYPLQTIFSYSDIQFANQCRKLLNETTPSSNVYNKLFAPLDALNNKEELLDTLAVYILDANMQTNKTCESLFLHRNTVQYRLNKIKATINCDFSKMSEMHLAFTAIALYRLQASAL